MRLLLPVLAIATLPLTCGLTTQQQAAQPALEQRASLRLTDEDLRISPIVDTVLASNREAVACLRRFLTKKLDPEAGNDFWYGPDLQQYGAPYSELYYAEFDSVGYVRFLPTVLSIAPVDDGLLMRVMWVADGSEDKPRYLFDFLARDTEDGMRLSFPIAHLTRTWERRRVGDITYVISPRHTFNVAEAQEQNNVIGLLSAFFDIPAFPITYYSFADPVDLFAAKGFEQHPLMYAIPSGGMVDSGDNVYAGNDKDIYTHEVIHLFTHRKFTTCPSLLDEGLATLIGGSTEHDYTWHRANMERYLRSDPTLDLRDRCNTYVRDDIDEDTSVPYMIGALLCERILRKDGKAGLFKAMASGADLWPALMDQGITPENLTAELRKEILLPPVRAPLTPAGALEEDR